MVLKVYFQNTMGRIRVSVVQIVNERGQNVNVVAALEIHYIRGRVVSTVLFRRCKEITTNK